MEHLTAWLNGERGRTTALANALGITHGAVSQWTNVPPQHVRRIAEITGIAPALLRPDLFQGMESAA